jgi:CRP-like cAMP-binding protein
MAAEAGVAELGVQNRILREMPPDRRERILSLGQTRSFVDGEQICKEGDAAGYVMIPLQGAVQISKTSGSGRRQVFCYMDTRSCPGVCLLLLPPLSPVDVVGIAPGSLLQLPHEHLVELSTTDRSFCSESWDAVGKCLAHFFGLVESLSFLKVSQRVVAALLNASSWDGGVVRRTQAELAAEIGTTREVVARCLAELQDIGSIKLGRGRIIVVNRGLLGKSL